MKDTKACQKVIQESSTSLPPEVTRHIKSILLALCNYGQVHYSQSDPRWKDTLKAYTQLCVACGDDPEPLHPGAPGHRIAFMAREGLEDEDLEFNPDDYLPRVD